MVVRIIILFWLAFCSSDLQAREEIHIAVASSLRGPVSELIASFEAVNPGYSVKVTYAATGKLVAQVQNGAPYQLLIAADPYFLQVLHERLLLASTPKTFVYGEIVLWHPNQTGHLEDLLKGARHIGIAQPLHAPYGRAAVTFLENQQWLKMTQEHFIFAENAAQVVHRVYAGAIPMGFVALSQVIELGIDPQHYSFLENAPQLPHTAALTVDGASHSGATQLYELLISEASQQLFERYGYQTIVDAKDRVYAASE